MRSVMVRTSERSVLPGFGLTMGFTFVVSEHHWLIPLSTLFLKTITLTWDKFCRSCCLQDRLRVQSQL